jgi:hypothetical protein
MVRVSLGNSPVSLDIPAMKTCIRNPLRAHCYRRFTSPLLICWQTDFIAALVASSTP